LQQQRQHISENKGLQQQSFSYFNSGSTDIARNFGEKISVPSSPTSPIICNKSRILGVNRWRINAVVFRQLRHFRQSRHSSHF
jgi:hypothetical protein